MTEPVSAIPKLPGLWIAMGTQEAKFIFRVTVHKKLKRQKRAEKERREGKKLGLGETAGTRTSPALVFLLTLSVGISILPGCPLVAAGRDIPSQTHFI